MVQLLSIPAYSSSLPTSLRIDASHLDSLHRGDDVVFPNFKEVRESDSRQLRIEHSCTMNGVLYKENEPSYSACLSNIQADESNGKNKHFKNDHFENHNANSVNYNWNLSQ